MAPSILIMGCGRQGAAVWERVLGEAEFQSRPVGKWNLKGLEEEEHRMEPSAASSILQAYL